MQRPGNEHGNIVRINIKAMPWFAASVPLLLSLLLVLVLFLVALPPLLLLLLLLMLVLLFISRGA